MSSCRSSWGALASTVYGCAAPAEKAPATPAGEPAPPSGSEDDRGDLLKKSETAEPPPESREEVEETPAQGGVRAAARKANADFDRAERELATSAGDCAAACRALASMERATLHLCDLAISDGDRARCDDAKARVLAARDRVRSTCGACSGGPSLERTAPIPSPTP